MLLGYPEIDNLLVGEGIPLASNKCGQDVFKTDLTNKRGRVIIGDAPFTAENEEFVIIGVTTGGFILGQFKEERLEDVDWFVGHLNEQNEVWELI